MMYLPVSPVAPPNNTTFDLDTIRNKGLAASNLEKSYEIVVSLGITLGNGMSEAG
jgi:hypothetical protein